MFHLHFNTHTHKEIFKTVSKNQVFNYKLLFYYGQYIVFKIFYHNICFFQKFFIVKLTHRTVRTTVFLPITLPENYVFLPKTIYN